MERLTNRIFVPKEERELVVFTQGEYIDTIPAEMTHEDIRKVLRRLAEYEDAEEQGLLLRLPCKAGSTVYLIRSRYTKCSKYKETWNDCYGCEDEDKCDSHEEYYIHINHSVSDEWIVIYMNDFGKTVFLTQKEAEQKLKEMESD